MSTYTFTVSGTDWNQIPIAPMTYQVTIAGYDYVFNVSGGSIPYTWTVESGQLPPGLTLDSLITRSQTDDELAGSPRTTGTFTFTMQVTDGAGHQASKQFSLTINPVPPPPVHHHGNQ